MAINKDWHLSHPMPPKPTLDDRIAWHIAHAANCDCRRDLPESIRKAIEARGLVVPTFGGRN